MKNIILLFCAALLMLGFNSCKETIVKWEDNSEPGRRDYVWDLDTIKVPTGEYTFLRGIWGANEKNIWAFGSATSYQYRLWHFDGNSWKQFEVPGLWDISSGVGCNENEMWLVTTSGQFWYWDGSIWQKNITIAIPDYDGPTMQQITRSDDGRYFVAGQATARDHSTYKAFIYTCENNYWKSVSIPDIAIIFPNTYWHPREGKIFLNGWKLDDPINPNRFYKIEGNNLIKIYEGSGVTGIDRIGDELYFKMGKKISRYRNGSFYEYKDFNGTEYRGRFFGRSENDFFTNNYDGLGHYNGTDLITIYKTDLQIQDVKVFQNDVYALLRDIDNYKDIILHGKLK